MMSTLPAPLRAAKQTAAILLGATIGLLLFTSPLAALFAVIGVVLSSVVKMNDSSVPVTKRRALAGLLDMFGGYAVAMSILGGITIVLAFLLAHQFVFWPVIAFFTLAACWLPLFFGIKRKRNSY